MPDESSKPLVNEIKDANNAVVAGTIENLTIGGTKAPIPRMAPAVVKWFTGRESILQKLVDIFTSRENVTGSPKIVALKGMGGIGKTTLATAIARHPLMEQGSPDGTLWVGLGPEPDLMSLLGEWGRQLGQDLSSDTTPDARSRAIQSILHDKCAFLVIDDAWRTEHAQLFAVGGDKCRVLLTTRNADVALEIAGEDVYPVATLSDEASTDLLKNLVPKAVTTEKANLRRLITQLGGLPLGLMIAGRLLAQELQAGLGVQGFLDELQAREKRLGMSSESRSLDAVLAMSYQWLSEEKYRYAFRLLGVFGGRPNTFSLSAAAEVCGLDMDLMRKIMIHLVNRALVEVAGEARYELHALVADYASNRLEESENRQGLLRHAGYFLKVVQQYTSENMQEWHVLDADWYNIRLSANWLNANVDSALVEDTTVLQLMADFAVALDLIVQVRKPVDGLTWLQAGEMACQRLGRQQESGWLLLTIGLVELDRGLFDQAIEHFTQCETLFASLNETRGLIYARGNLGLVHHKRGEYSKALRIHRQVTKLCKSAGDTFGMAVSYCNQAEVHYLLGEFSKALSPLKKSILICRQQSIQDVLVKALILNGKVLFQTKDETAGSACIEEAYKIAEQSGSNIWLGVAAQAMGEVREYQGELETARVFFQKSIELLTAARVQEELAEAYVAYGIFLAQNKQIREARAHLSNAIHIFEQIGASSRARKINNELVFLVDM